MRGNLSRVFVVHVLSLCLGCASVIANDTDAGSDPDAGNDPDAGDDNVCDSTAVCVPALPAGWSGPVVVAEDPTDPPTCPTGYPATSFVTQRDLVAAPANCNCGCVVDSAQCTLFSENTDSLYSPAGICDDAPSDDDCLSAVLDGTCESNSSDALPPLSWETQARLCEGAAPGNTCDGGTCFATAAEFGPVCIFQSGDLICPEGFPDGTVYFGNASDARGCAPCECTVAGGQCEIEIEVCSVGFINRTLTSGGAPYCLPSPGDGDDVTFLTQAITSQPACTPSAGTPTGDAAPESPVTVCCL